MHWNPEQARRVTSSVAVRCISPLTLTMAAMNTGLLLVAPSSTSLSLSGPCFSDNFLGNYRDGGAQLSIVAVPDPSCLDHFGMQLSAGHYAQLPEVARRLVWLEKVSIDEKLLSSGQTGLDELWSSLQRPQLDYHAAEQEVVLTDKPAVTAEHHILYQTESAALVSLSKEKARVVDTLLPRFWRSTLIPTGPVTHTPIPYEATEVVRDITSKVKFDPVIASVVNNISIPQIKNDIRFLTGEDPKSGIVSRHSFTTGAMTAAHWLKDRVENTGAKCRLMSFLEGFSPNVIWYVLP